MVVVGITTAVALAANITGWSDLATISLCLTQTITPDLYVGVALLFGTLFSGASVVLVVVMLLRYWMVQPRTDFSGEKGLTADAKSPTVREIRRISGPYLAEQQHFDMRA